MTALPMLTFRRNSRWNTRNSAIGSVICTRIVVVALCGPPAVIG